MKLRIAWIDSADVEDVTAWRPAAAAEVYFPLTVDIGAEGEEWSSSFQVVVTTPEGLRAFAQRCPESPFPDRALLVFSHYSWEALHARLLTILDHCSRATWDACAACLQRYFRWEYEDWRLIEAMVAITDELTWEPETAVFVAIMERLALALAPAHPNLTHLLREAVAEGAEAYLDLQEWSGPELRALVQVSTAELARLETNHNDLAADPAQSAILIHPWRELHAMLLTAVRERLA